MEIVRSRAGASREITGNLLELKVVVLDAMNTLFLRGDIFSPYHKVLRDLKVEQVDHGKLVDIYHRERARHKFLVEMARRNGEKPPGKAEAWTEINSRILWYFAREKVAGKAKHIGRQIHEEYIGDPAGFAVHDHMLEFLGAVHGKVMIVIASNKEHDTLVKFVSHFGLSHFVGDMVFTSERLGVEKPHRDFYVRLVGEISSAVGQRLEPHNLLMVGNNIENDFNGAREAGMHAVLLDWEERHVGVEEAGIVRITDPRKLLRMEFAAK